MTTKIVNHRHALSHAVAGWDQEGTPYLEGVTFAKQENFQIVGNGTLQAPLAVERVECTMADRFVRYYREWANLDWEDHERSGGTFTDFTEYARTKADAEGGHPLTYLQWWNCKPCTVQQGVAIPNIRASFAVVEFDDGSYAMSPNHELEDGRRWIVGRPA